jgi:hypothetical protein
MDTLSPRWSALTSTRWTTFTPVLGKRLGVKALHLEPPEETQNGKCNHLVAFPIFEFSHADGGETSMRSKKNAPGENARRV